MPPMTVNFTKSGGYGKPFSRHYNDCNQSVWKEINDDAWKNGYRIDCYVLDTPFLTNGESRVFGRTLCYMNSDQ